jgi:hypothetical protein
MAGMAALPVSATRAGIALALRVGEGMAAHSGVGALLWTRPLRPLYAAGAIAAGVVMGAALVEGHLARSDEYVIDIKSLEIRERPLWLDDDWVKTIRNPFGERHHVNLFESGVVERIHAAYAECPWIEEVCHVRKEFPNRLSVKIKVRTPVAAVWEGMDYVLVDAAGVVLPRRFRTVPDFGFNVLVVEGVSTLSPSPGRQWQDPGVDAAVAMACLFRSRKDPILSRVARIDVSAVGLRKQSHSEVLLFAREGGGRIEWGRSPAIESPLEISVDDKIENLKSIFNAIADFKKAYVQPRKS